MPLYEYTCESCGHDIELLIRGNEQPRCSSCDSTRLSKRLSVPAAHTGTSGSLPICQAPAPAGGCGAPWCGTGGCGADFD